MARLRRSATCSGSSGIVVSVQKEDSELDRCALGVPSAQLQHGPSRPRAEGRAHLLPAPARPGHAGQQRLLGLSRIIYDSIPGGQRVRRPSNLDGKSQPVLLPESRDFSTAAVPAPSRGSPTPARSGSRSELTKKTSADDLKPVLVHDSGLAEHARPRRPAPGRAHHRLRRVGPQPPSRRRRSGPTGAWSCSRQIASRRASRTARARQSPRVGRRCSRATPASSGCPAPSRSTTRVPWDQRLRRSRTRSAPSSARRRRSIRQTSSGRRPRALRVHRHLVRPHRGERSRCPWTSRRTRCSSPPPPRSDVPATGPEPPGPRVRDVVLRYEQGDARAGLERRRLRCVGDVQDRRRQVHRQAAFRGVIGGRSLPAHGAGHPRPHEALLGRRERPIAARCSRPCATSSSSWRLRRGFLSEIPARVNGQAAAGRLHRAATAVGRWPAIEAATLDVPSPSTRPCSRCQPAGTPAGTKHSTKAAPATPCSARRSAQASAPPPLTTWVPTGRSSTPRTSRASSRTSTCSPSS